MVGGSSDIEAEDRKRALDLAASLRDFYGEYRTRKEREAYGTTVAYLGATVALLAHNGRSDYGCLVLSGISVATAAVVLLVWWQISNLLFAARMVGASITVHAQWLERAPKRRELRAARLSDDHPDTLLPETMVDEFHRQHVHAVERARFGAPLLLLWGGAVIWHLLARCTCQVG